MARREAFPVWSRTAVTVDIFSLGSRLAPVYAKNLKIYAHTYARVRVACVPTNGAATRQGHNPLQVAGDGNASEGNPDMESRYKVRREFFRQDPRNRTLILHHPGEM